MPDSDAVWDTLIRGALVLMGAGVTPNIRI